MNNFIKFCISEKKVTIAISLMILVLGLFSYFMPRQEMPDTSNPAVQVTTLFPGASAKTIVEEQVTKKIEDEIAALDGVYF